MRARTRSTLAIAITLTLLLAGCLRISGDCSETGLPYVGGSWKGVAHLGALGTIPMHLNLNQNNDCVNGAWITDNEKTLGSEVGAVSGNLDETGRLELIFDPMQWEACSLDVQLSLQNDKLSGNLKHRNCQNSVNGGIELNRLLVKP